MKQSLSVLVICLILLGCGSDKLPVADAFEDSTGESNGALDQNDLPQAVELTSRLLSASRDGTEADVLVAYRISEVARENLAANALLRFELVFVDGSSRHLITVRVSSDEPTGEVELTIPLSENVTTIVARLSGLDSEIAETLNSLSTISLPDFLELADTDLSQYEAFEVALVEQSYASSVERNRRIHRFAITVKGRNKSTGTMEYITGLEDEVTDYFEVVEGDIVDVESPVSISHEDERIAVYFVLDASSSIVQGGTAHHLQDAVSRMAIVLAPAVDFDFRVFAEDVRYLDSLRDLHFDADDSSGTAFYRALDTALDDIDQRGPAARDTILIGITDGIDRASLNYYYPTYQNHTQVRDYVAQRVRNIREAQSEFYNRDLVGHIISLGISEEDPNIDYAALDSFATSSEMQHTFMQRLSNTDIQDKFADMTRSIRGVYYLEYSSQQVPGVDPLRLNYHIEDTQGSVAVKP